MFISGHVSTKFKNNLFCQSWHFLCAKITILSFCCMGLISCGSTSNFASGALSPVNETEIPVISTPQSPFSLQITHVQNDGRNLRVEGIIATKSPWYVDKVTVGLIGYKDGVEVASVAKPLKDFLNQTQLGQINVSNAAAPSAPVLREDVPLAFSLSLPSDSISDYQVTLGWGNEATITKSKHVVWGEQTIVDLGADPKCVVDDCRHLYAVEGTLQNDGQEGISAVIVTLKLQIANLENADQSNSSSDSSELEEIDLSPLNLLPGASQRVRLRFKNSIDAAPMGGIKAEVKVKSVK
jgi:hypothetical protein